MTLRKIFFIAMFCLPCVSLPAHARSPVPIINHEGIAVTTTNDNPIIAEQVKEAFMNAGRTRDWTFTAPADDHLVGTLRVRNKHAIIIDIRYTGEQYSVTYKDSVNMKYRMAEVDDETVPVIHPFYNNWVNELLDAVRVELSRYLRTRVPVSTHKTAGN